MKENGRIYTNVFIKTENTIKGKIDSKEFILCSPGGTLGKVKMQLVGAPTYSVGENVLVFCEPLAWKEDCYTNYASRLGKKTIKNGLVIEEGISLDEYINKIKNYK